jgi:hypothetical protein
MDCVARVRASEFADMDTKLPVQRGGVWHECVRPRQSSRNACHLVRRECALVVMLVSGHVRWHTVMGPNNAKASIGNRLIGAQLLAAAALAAQQLRHHVGC